VSNITDASGRPDYASLSPAERELLLHVLGGHSNSVIGQCLGLTEAAAKVRLKRLLRKLRLENRTQATIWAHANAPQLLFVLVFCFSSSWGLSAIA
jgi:DNA-binding CsgD family transcriptional regulator